jgi:hypothetical protein
MPLSERTFFLFADLIPLGGPARQKGVRWTERERGRQPERMLTTPIHEDTPGLYSPHPFRQAPQEDAPIGVRLARRS